MKKNSKYKKSEALKKIWEEVEEETWKQIIKQ